MRHDVRWCQCSVNHTDMMELMKVVLNLLNTESHSLSSTENWTCKSGLFCVSRINVGMLDVSSCCTVTVQI